MQRFLLIKLILFFSITSSQSMNNNTSGGELFEKFQRQKLSRETVNSAGSNGNGER